jgi:signal peptide peptidase SppA
MRFMQKTIWAITPEMMETMAEIAYETRKSPEAIAKEMGRDMKNTNAVSFRDGVAVIKVAGPLFRYANLMTRICGATSYEILAQDFNKALQDTQIKAVLLDIDSPGGEVNGCSEISDMIFKARGSKPIIAYASGSCCSGAYWIASSCDKILAADTAVLGSIGVVSIFENADDGKTVEIVSSQSPNKRPDINTKEGRAHIQARVDELAEVFISKVARNRGIAAADVVQNFGQGDVFVGSSAVRNGLADGLSSFEDIIASLSMEKTFMNEQNQVSAEEIKTAERKRMADVFASEASRGKETTAQALLAMTDLSAANILSILDTIPNAKQNAFEAAMAELKNPNIQPAQEEAEETVEAVASRIASHIVGD